MNIGNALLWCRAHNFQTKTIPIVIIITDYILKGGHMFICHNHVHDVAIWSIIIYKRVFMISIYLCMCCSVPVIAS